MRECPLLPGLPIGRRTGRQIRAGAHLHQCHAGQNSPDRKSRGGSGVRLQRRPTFVTPRCRTRGPPPDAGRRQHCGGLHPHQMRWHHRHPENNQKHRLSVSGQKLKLELQRKPPTRILGAISYRLLDARICIGAIHGLQEKVLKIEIFIMGRIKGILRIDYLDFGAGFLPHLSTCFWAHADPV